MNHLTDEEFEDIMQGGSAGDEHLRQCPQCREILAEKRAMAARLRSAFGSVETPPALADRIRQRLDRSQEKMTFAATVQNASCLRHRIWPAVAAAAVVLVLLLPLSFYLSAPSSAKAAHAELVAIHEQNLTPHHEFYSSADPGELARYFKENLGFSPALPCVGQGMAIRGCCIAHFKGRIAGSYVVDTPKGVISVIVVTDTPRSMGMKRMSGKTKYQQTFWAASFARCKMVTVRLGGYSYCAVGEISQEYLRDLLVRLLPDGSR